MSLLAKAGKPAAKLVPMGGRRHGTRFGLMKGEIRISEDFDPPHPEEIQGDFEGAQ